MDENDYGSRDQKGHYIPNELNIKNPLWIKPLNIKKIINWFFYSYIFSWNLFYFAVAFFSWLFLTPSLEKMEILKWDWALIIFTRNLFIVVLFFSLIHIPLYVKKLQGIKFKFNPKWPTKKQQIFTFNKQIFDNLFWSLCFGVPIWTLYEVLSLWFFASGKLEILNFNNSPFYFIFIMMLIPFFRDAHFYLTHRLLHWKLLYKIAHNVHHRNINPGPWSSLSMHPIEHILYFSGVIIHWILLSHPLHAMYHIFHAGLGSANGHIGFKQMLLNDNKAIDLSNYNHYLHHKYFEVNYGNLMIPFDQWFNTYHDGSPELHQIMGERIKSRRLNNQSK